MGLVANTVSTSQSGRPIHVSEGDKNHELSCVRLPDELEDIRLLLDQRLKIEFEWVPYVDLEIISYIPLKVLDNQEMWDTNVPLIVNATVEMHELDWVLQQFGYRQRIPPLPRDIKELHKVDIRGKNDGD
ncbi:hypothetical protein J1N35_035222 [Gossypium stocksii]|uniref:Aminotransferase-like plant mobile domain-containing protein n=1 Tax=Gossypium stocksii TaxID=47602 RepID=A0A9D3ZRA2_9ROSI|nr:hypothetical protein J1N35_035222 [Gossypium stocksii]